MVCGPSWFAIKKSRDFIDGPKLIFQMIQAIHHLSEKDIAGITLPVIQRNCFCLQPGNFLAALLYSKEENHRAQAMKKILESRTNPILIPRHGEKDGMRINVIPTINFNSQEWSTLINLEDVDCFQPPRVEEFNDEVVANIVQNRGTPPNIPCHSQTVKRAVKVTSDSSKKAVSLSKRNNIILAKCKSRMDRKCFKTKKDYNLS